MIVDLSFIQDISKFLYLQHVYHFSKLVLKCSQVIFDYGLILKNPQLDISPAEDF